MEKLYKTKFRLKTYTVHENEPSEGPYKKHIKIHDSAGLYNYAKSIYADLDADKEHCTLLSLNNKNFLTGEKTISTGSLTASLFSLHVFSPVWGILLFDLFSLIPLA